MAADPKTANDPTSTGGKVIQVVLTIVFIVSFLATFHLNYNPDVFQGMKYSETVHHYHNADQFAYMGDALIHGRLDMDLPVPDELLALENPYNTQDRIAMGSEDIPLYWDHAYYEGKYYCYFGVIPIVMFYVPYELITGQYMPTPLAIAIAGVLAIIAVCLLGRRIALRYFPETATTLSIMVCCFVFFTASNFIYLAFVARFYSIPIVMSLFFTSLGLWFWLGSVRARDAGRHGGSEEVVSIPLIAAGSFCMACNLGCRPQFILACLLAFPIFYRQIFKTRALFSKKGLGATIAAIVPFVVVFVPLLAYNYARFGSPFDLGSNYNLTGFDMTNYYQWKKLTAWLIYSYLIQPIPFTDTFPYVATAMTEHPEYGWAPNEPCFGGIFMLKPLLIAALLFPFCFKDLRKRHLFALMVMCLVFFVIVLIVDTRKAGITQRYFSDFAYYLAIMASVTILSFQVKLKDNVVGRRIGIALVSIAIAFTCVVGTLTLLSPDRYDAIAANNPTLYSQIAGLFGA